MSHIEVKNLGKAYKIYPGRWSRLGEWVLPFLGQCHQLTWVLKDINFCIEPGEAVGIVGINGAGKYPAEDDYRNHTTDNGFRLNHRPDGCHA